MDELIDDDAPLCSALAGALTRALDELLLKKSSGRTVSCNDVSCLVNALYPMHTFINSLLFSN